MIRLDIDDRQQQNEIHKTDEASTYCCCVDQFTICDIRMETLNVLYYNTTRFHPHRSFQRHITDLSNNTNHKPNMGLAKNKRSHRCHADANEKDVFRLDDVASDARVRPTV